FLAAGEALLRRPELTAAMGEVFRVGDLLTRRERYQRGNAQVQPDCGVGQRQRRNVLLHQEGDEVASRWVLGDGDGAGSAAEGARPADVQRRVHLGERQRAFFSLPAEGRGGVLRRLTSVLLLERRVSGPSLEEVAKGAIEMAQRLLRWHAR